LPTRAPLRALVLVVDEVPEDLVGEAALEAAQSAFAALAGRSFLGVVLAAPVVVALVRERDDVQRVVELPVARAGQPVSHDFAGGDLQRRGAACRHAPPAGHPSVGRDDGKYAGGSREACQG
jgi:hypothetical protein